MTIQPDQHAYHEEEMEEADWSQLLDEYDYARPQRGELREGLIMQVEDNGVLVSIGTKREGIIPWNDIRQMGDDTTEESLTPGQTLQVYVQDPENRDGELILSLAMVQVARDWEEAARLYEEGGITSCKVIGFNKGGLLVQFNRIRGFVPASQVAQLHGRTAAEERQQALQRMVNQEIPLKVIEVDRDRNRLVFSERSATQEWRKAQKQRLLTELQPGDILTGRVNQLTNFGAFIDLGGADGLAHISELSWQRVNHPREVLSNGQEVQVLVVEIDRDRERIGLSLRKLQENPWDSIDQRYSLGQLITGPVTNVTPFGAFVQVEEAVEGLIHASELDVDPHIQPRDVLQPGQEVTAKVISLDRQRQRMGLSLRRVTEEQQQRENESAANDEENQSAANGEAIDVAVAETSEAETSEAETSEAETSEAETSEAETLEAPAVQAESAAETSSPAADEESAELEVPETSAEVPEQAETLQETGTPAEDAEDADEADSKQGSA
jgi:small subunit ribosomal protein S1